MPEWSRHRAVSADNLTLQQPHLVRILAPSGGERLTIGDQVTIWWKTDVAIAGTGVTFELLRGGEFVMELGIDWDPSGERTTPVTLPPTNGKPPPSCS